MNEQSIRELAIGLLVTVTLSSSLVARGSDPLGSEFQVNSYTTGPQSAPAVTAGPTGDFVVVWNSGGFYPGEDGPDGSLSGIQGQRFDASGAPAGLEFQVNTYTPFIQEGPDAAIDSLGNFVVVWNSLGSPEYYSDGYEILGQRFDASGSPLGLEFQVNQYLTGDQIGAEVAMAPTGQFVVVWMSYGSYGSDSDAYSVQARRYDADGLPLGPQFQVNTYTTSTQSLPDVASDPQGKFIVTWGSFGSAGSDADQSIQAQLFEPSGALIGSEFQVNSYTTGVQGAPAVAADSLGNFAIVWQSFGSYGTDTDFASIQGQRYDFNGLPLGGQFQVNTATSGTQYNPVVATDSSDGFIVAWDDLSAADVQAQRFDASGTPVGGEFQVNTYTTGSQSSPDVTTDPSGNFVVTWNSSGSSGTDTDGFSIQGQRFETPIFADGFESGDTSNWSSSQ